MCSHSVPSRDQLERAGHDLPGRREDHAARDARPRPPGRDQHASPPATEDRLESLLVTLLHRRDRASPAARARASAAAPTGVAGHRLDDDGHLPARVRGAGELIARRPPRTAAGSSGPASSASGRRSAARRRGSGAEHVAGRRASGGSASGRISTLSPAMRRAQVPFGISNSSSRERDCDRARTPPSRATAASSREQRAASDRRRARIAHCCSRIRTSCT